MSTGMERKRKLSEEIKKNDQAKRKKTALVHNQTWDALDLSILAKIFDLLPSHELFWNVSLVCSVWQLACWDKLFWKNNGFLDLTAAAPFQCCRDDDDDKSTSSSVPKEGHNHKCSDLMIHQLQTILFGTHDAYGNSLGEWRSSIKTIRIPFELKICNDFLHSLSSPELVLVEPAAEHSRTILVLPGIVSSWNLKRLLLESPLFRKPIFTNFVDVDDWKVFKYILRSNFMSSSVDLMTLYRSLPADVIEHCRTISQHLKDMVEKLTNCGILPKVLTEAEHLCLYKDTKSRKFRKNKDESMKLACQQDSNREIHEFWLAIEDLFSDDKKNICFLWLWGRAKSVFVDHYYALRVAESPYYISFYTGILHGSFCFSARGKLLKRSAEREWHLLLVQEGVAKVPTKVSSKEKEKVPTKVVQQDTNTEQQRPSDPLQADAKKQTQKQKSSPHVPPIRKKYFSYAKYQEIAKGRRKFMKKLLKIHLPHLPTSAYERVRVLTHSSMKFYDQNPKYLVERAYELYLKECMKLLKLWGGGPYYNLE